MRELRTRKATRDGSRIRSVQGRLSIEVRNEDEAGGEPAKADPSAKSSGFRRPAKPSAPGPERSAGGGRPPAPVFHPLAYRSVVADWPIAWREEWGRRANELEESGLSWRDAETQAFVEIWHKVQREGQVALSPSDSEEAVPAGDEASPSPLGELPPADDGSSHADPPPSLAE